jgi:hypothetical protein
LQAFLFLGEPDQKAFKKYWMKLITKIRSMILFFMLALILSGATAMPAETGLRRLMQYKDMLPLK